MSSSFEAPLHVGRPNLGDRARFMARMEEMFDRRFVRMWDLYLRGCAASFKVTGLDVYQLLFSKGLNNQLNLTFDHLYPQSLESFETDDGLSVQESQG